MDPAVEVGYKGEAGGDQPKDPREKMAQSFC